MKRLIITADDFGLAKSINEGIAMAVREGVVNSVSVVPAGEALDDALSILKDLPLNEVGAHLSLTETRPVLKSSPYRKNHNTLFFDIISGKVDMAAAGDEFRAQLDVLKNAGLKISHINSHEHIHMIPEVLKVFIALAREYGIPCIRYPRLDRPAGTFSMNEKYKKFVMSYFAKGNEKLYTGSGLFFTDFFFGLLDAGALDEKRLLKILHSVKDGVTEIVCHPGLLSPRVLERYSWHAGCEAELFALTSSAAADAIKNGGMERISYSNLPSIKKDE